MKKRDVKRSTRVLNWRCYTTRMKARAVGLAVRVPRGVGIEDCKEIEALYRKICELAQKKLAIN